jgi:hypothetical protein
VIQILPCIILCLSTSAFQIYINSYDTNFDAPDAHFDNSCLFSDSQAENLEIQNVLIVKTHKKTQTECPDMKPSPLKERAMHERDINPSF